MWKIAGCPALHILSENENVSLICSSFVDFSRAADLKHEHHKEIHYKLIKSVDLFAAYVFSSHILKASESLAYPSVIYRSDIYKHAKGRNDLYGKLDDGPFVIECARGGKIVQITTPLVCIRRHLGQDSHDPATACTIEQIFNGNAFYKSFMEKRPDTMKLFWMICGRHLKAHSNFGNGTFGILTFIRRAIAEHQIKLRSFLLVFEYALQRVLGLKRPLLLHRYLWRKTHLLFDERTVCLDCPDENQRR